MLSLSKRMLVKTLLFLNRLSFYTQKPYFTLKDTIQFKKHNPIECYHIKRHYLTFKDTILLQNRLSFAQKDYTF